MFKFLRNRTYTSNVDRETLLDQLFDDTRRTSRRVQLAANGQFQLPAGYKIDSIVIHNTTANAVTGGIRIGTAAAGTQVVVAQAVGANALLQIADAAILSRVFSMTAIQNLFIEAVTAWNSAVINVYIKVSKVA